MPDNELVRSGGHIDARCSEDIAARVRAALRNNRERIVIRFEEDAVIESDQLLGFLLTVHRYMAAQDHELVIEGGGPAARELLSVLGLQAGAA
ncbi:MAG: STAS domain-containing protein [Planctomycetota bacterium]